jgi:hypothetical protein
MRDDITNIALMQGGKMQDLNNVILRGRVEQPLGNTRLDLKCVGLDLLFLISQSDLLNTMMFVIIIDEDHHHFGRPVEMAAAIDNRSQKIFTGVIKHIDVVCCECYSS